MRYSTIHFVCPLCILSYGNIFLIWQKQSKVAQIYPDELPQRFARDGWVYEYFLQMFAMDAGQGAENGEFYTLSSIVMRIAEFIELYIYLQYCT